MKPETHFVQQLARVVEIMKQEISRVQQLARVVELKDHQKFNKR